MARADRIRKQIAARRAYNERAREINQRRRERARAINQGNRAMARREFNRLTRSPSIESTEALQRSLADNQARFDQTNIGLDDQERSLGIAYGMGQFGGDAASNPYSRAAMLQRSYNQNQRATTNTMASRGQLYSGATQNAANTNTFNYGSAYDALSKDFGARQSQIGTQRQAASDTLASANESAYRQSISDASRQFPVTRENAPRMPKPKKFVPRFRPLRPPIRRPRPNRPQGPSGGVRP